MLTALFAWMTSSCGKVVAKWGAIAAAVGLAYWRIRESGRAAERADRAYETTKAAANREKIHDQVSKLPDADVRDELSGWVRDDI
ncbi:hypothetical protein [Rhizobium sp. 1399]|uniref:hypothetical protein n=1 Tax=Rhizobium sp. 1399 TaxID=2817758 RepID=UPI0028675B03|nr:hypothetical protein [Rhizobium sp. 1399]MDR6664046.1 hypothetical protein [Rhizobium sp. 1399]